MAILQGYIHLLANKAKDTYSLGKKTLKSILGLGVSLDGYMISHEASHLTAGEALGQNATKYNLGDTPLVEYLEHNGHISDNDSSSFLYDLIDTLDAGPIGKSIDSGSIEPLKESGKQIAGLGKKAVEGDANGELRNKIENSKNNIEQSMQESTLGYVRFEGEISESAKVASLSAGHIGPILLNLGIAYKSRKDDSTFLRSATLGMTIAQEFNILKDVYLTNTGSDIYKICEITGLNPIFLSAVVAGVAALPAAYAFSIKKDEKPSRTLKELQDEINKICLECKNLEKPELDYNVD